MMMKRILKTVLALCTLVRACIAIVIEAPGGRMGRERVYSPASTETSTQQPISLRIRSTKKSDLDDVAHMLAMAYVDPYQKHINNLNNFRIKMEMLKAKAGYSPMLQSRIKALETGRQVADSMGPLPLNNSDVLRFIWSNDVFRNNVHKAAKMSGEPHIWSRHNFAYAPKCSRWLQHKMFTAEDTLTGQIVGFCEVAMLTDPTKIGYDDDDGDDYENVVAKPTIANLAVSPDYRRRGIASRLVNSASRFVKQEWDSEDLTLYVEKENQPAISAYSKMGFNFEAEITLKSIPHWYMVQNVQVPTPAEALPAHYCI